MLQLHGAVQCQDPDQKMVRELASDLWISFASITGTDRPRGIDNVEKSYALADLVLIAEGTICRPNPY